ncbi:MAG TPA: sigma-70 family RNA polymerase sigma factor [Thermoleophilaceae bacterium]|jgi:RNA polymerase sigma-70 factor (ECF subfamily)
MDDDDRLIAALQRGDEQAFASLVESLGPALLRLAQMHVPSRSVAEEVVQETWLAVLQGLDRFERRSSLRTWIFRILLNKAKTRGQRERRIVPFALFRRRGGSADDDGRAVDEDRFQPPDAETLPGWWALPPERWESPEERLIGAEARDAMLSAIAALPRGQRDVIVLRDVEGWDAREVCNVLELSETNQRVLLHRARSKVRAALERHFEDSEEPGS